MMRRKESEFRTVLTLFLCRYNNDCYCRWRRDQRTDHRSLRGLPLQTTCQVDLVHHCRMFHKQ